MKVSDILSKELIIESLQAVEKREALDEMASVLAREVDGLKKEELLEALLERERLGSTGIGCGVAIPHAKLKGIDAIAVAFAKSARGVDFQSLDKKPVYLLFLIVAPESSTAFHLKVLSSISRLLKDSVFRQRLIKAGTRDEIYAIIVEEDNKVARGAAL